MVCIHKMATKPLFSMLKRNHLHLIYFELICNNYLLTFLIKAVNTRLPPSFTTQPNSIEVTLNQVKLKNTSQFNSFLNIN
jgi:hypothetical protein